ncbi:MAG: hypothetical protein QXV69_08415 [Sulfolobaceae archaeon]
MKFYFCKNCGRPFLERKLKCSCGSFEFGENEVNSGRIVYSVMLSVPPKDYPDKIYLNLVTDGKIKLFCFSLVEVSEGEEVKIIEENGKIFCEKKDRNIL